ncbi:MAG TPA: 2TM domain-containing protein [Gaiellaceae bacterium]|nr:2TM domain-containing protein [Gaiellaceae bacterium]
MDDPTLLDEARRRLHRKQRFESHVASFVFVNAIVWAIWALTSDRSGTPWPIWITAIWGFGLLWDAWETFGRRPITDEDVRREAERMRR